MSPLLSLYLGRTATTGTPSLTLNSPANAGTAASTTPTLSFTGVTSSTDQGIPYEVQIDTVNTFNSQVSALTRDTANEPSTNPFTTTLNFSTARTSDSFTPQANAAIFVVVGLADNGSVPSATVTDSLSNSYTLLSANDTPNSNLTAVYWNYYTTSPGSITVTVHSTNSSNGGMFEVLNYLGASPVQNGNVFAIARPTAGTIQGPLTVGSGNIAIGAGSNWNGSTALTALANTTIAGHFEDTGDGDSYSSFTSATTGTNTYGYTDSTIGSFLAIEIIGGGTPLIDVLSSAGTGFADITNGANTSPYPSGDQVGYTIQAGNALTNGNTYFWRTRQVVPSNNVNYYTAWSSTFSFTVSTGGIPTSGQFFIFFNR